MNKINTKIGLHLQCGVFAVIWLLAITASSVSSVTDLFKTFSIAVTFYAFFGYIFIKSAWRWKIFQYRSWLVKIPNLQGTWQGKLISSWINPSTDKKIPPIAATLVIKQDFNRIYCSLYTKESSSYSTAAEIYTEPDGALYLSYNYTNKPRMSVRERSEIHDGAAILNIIKDKATYFLAGEYWTSRQTRGEMEFIFDSKKITKEFKK